MFDSIRQRVVKLYKERLPEVGKMFAARIGPSIGSKPLNQRQQADLWNFVAPGQQPAVDAYMQMLGTGVPSGQAIAQVWPGVPPAMLIRGWVDKEKRQPNPLAVWPWREYLIGPGTPRQRTEKAEALAKLAARYQAMGETEPVEDVTYGA